MRLQKYLSECGVASRRKAEDLITEGKVRVNGKLVTELGTRIQPGVDRVTVGKRSVLPPPKGVLYLNKPRSVVSTLSDPGGRKTVADFLTKKYRSYFPVGRLDFDSTGLVLMTNDGELAERLSHPRYGMERVYRVKVRGVISERTLEQIRKGVKLSDGVASAVADVLDQSERYAVLEVRIAEGRNRVIRRIMERVRHPVLELHRIAHGPARLGKLKTGQIRVLTEKEYALLREKVFGGQKAARPARATETKKRPLRQKSKGRPT